MSVEDKDEPNTPAWKAKFTIVSGDPQGLFTVKTGVTGLEGIITTAKVGSRSQISHCVKVRRYLFFLFNIN